MATKNATKQEPKSKPSTSHLPEYGPVSPASVDYPVSRMRLGNGLKVVLSPDNSAAVVAVGVLYNVGIRREPQGRTGFAHLFEHMMFQGSAHVARLEHMRQVQAAGGSFNGSTHLDYTDYYEVLPSRGLERALFLEADRMRGPALTPSNLANQVAVVEEEIRVNVLNQPYGGFPWLRLPELFYDTWPNSHDGYGSFGDLEAASVADAQGFFDSFYAPNNAVLVVAGDIDVAATKTMIRRHFAAIARRSVPRPVRLSEPDLPSERHSTHHDPQATMPAVAMAWRTPDPAKLRAYLPYVVLAEVLTDGDSSRLVQRLVLQERVAVGVAGYCGFMGDPFDAADPTAFLLEIHFGQDSTHQRVTSLVDEELQRLATEGIEAAELARVQARLSANLLSEVDSLLPRALRLGVMELRHGRAELVGELPALLAEVTPEQIRRAAGALVPSRRAVLDLVCGGAE